MEKMLDEKIRCLHLSLDKNLNSKFDSFHHLMIKLLELLKLSKIKLRRKQTKGWWLIQQGVYLLGKITYGESIGFELSILKEIPSGKDFVVTGMGALWNRMRIIRVVFRIIEDVIFCFSGPSCLGVYYSSTLECEQMDCGKL